MPPEMQVQGQDTSRQKEGAIPPPPGYANQRVEGSDALHQYAQQERDTASSICLTAAALVGGSRATTHGNVSVNFQNTADLWNALLRAKLGQAGITDLGVLKYVLLTPLDVANMLEAFKIARRYSGTHNLDDYIDGAGYAACAGEIAANVHTKDEQILPRDYRSTGRQSSNR